MALPVSGLSPMGRWREVGSKEGALVVQDERQMNGFREQRVNRRRLLQRNGTRDKSRRGELDQRKSV